MAIPNVFTGSGFTQMELTTSVNKLPGIKSRIGELGLFSPKSIHTTVALLEENQGILQLVPATPRGSPPTVSGRGTRRSTPLNVPRIALQDKIANQDVQDIRAFGSETELQVVSGIVNERMTVLRNSIEATWEWMRAGAVKGIVLDADGTTSLYNLYTTFAVPTPTAIDFALGTDTTKVITKCLDGKRAMEKVLQGVSITKFVGLCSPEFFDALTTHPTVKDAYRLWQESAALRNDNRTNFSFGGIEFEEYLNSVGGTPFIPAGDCRLFPVGVPDLFQVIYAPADFLDQSNTMGQPMYAKMAEGDKWGTSMDICVQSNPLFICSRPSVLIRAYSSN